MFIDEKQDNNKLTPNLNLSYRYDFYKMISIALDLRMTGSNDSGTNMLTSIDRENLVNLLKETSQAYLSCRDLSAGDQKDFIYQYFSDLLTEIQKEITEQNTIPVVQVISSIIYNNFENMLTPIEKFAFSALNRFPTRENWLVTMDKIGVNK